MASDWIKMRTDLYRDPKVCVIADLLLDANSGLAKYVSQNLQSNMSVTRNVMRNATVGALVAVWGVLRQRGKRNESDLVLQGMTPSIVDDIADIHEFGAALEFVGWLKQTEEGIVLPNFFSEYNVDPEELNKKKNAERQRRFREKNRNVTQDVTVTSQSNVREEKRRDKYIPGKTHSKKTPIPEGWKPKPETVSPLAAEFGFTNGDAERYTAAFVDACKAKGYQYQDFDAAFRNCVRKDWPGFRNGAKTMPKQAESNRPSW